MRNCFLPPKIADRLHQEIGHPPELDHSFRTQRLLLAPGDELKPGALKVYSAGGREVEPGTLETTLDTAGQEAFNGLDQTMQVLAILKESFGSSGMVATVHYGRNYDNAFWDGSQMVFGDGDGRIFSRFTKPIDVCAHELGHGVTGDLLDYQDQAGALNESMSDAQGATVRQRALSLDPHDPDAWLIGAKTDLFMPAFTGRALRDMLNPGTAYKDDPVLGSDDQPRHMADYDHTADDNGGVHTNSGIPNRAFALTAQAIGSINALALWRSALASVNDPGCTFAKFAQATVAQAGGNASVVQAAWIDVGVLSGDPAPLPQPGGPSSDGPFPGATPAVAARIVHAAGGEEHVPFWMNHHFESYFRIRG